MMISNGSSTRKTKMRTLLLFFTIVWTNVTFASFTSRRVIPESKIQSKQYKQSIPRPKRPKKRIGRWSMPLSCKVFQDPDNCVNYQRTLLTGNPKNCMWCKVKVKASNGNSYNCINPSKIEICTRLESTKKKSQPPLEEKFNRLSPSCVHCEGKCIVPRLRDHACMEYSETQCEDLFRGTFCPSNTGFPGIHKKKVPEAKSSNQVHQVLKNAEFHKKKPEAKLSGDERFRKAMRKTRKRLQSRRRRMGIMEKMEKMNVVEELLV